MSSAFKKLLSNFSSLSGLQIFGYLFPLISMPYLISTLGAEKFGLIVFAQTIVGYFVLFVDYGFSLSATKEIAENKENSNQVNKIFTAVIYTKLILCISGLIILHIITSSFERLQNDYWVYMISYGVVIGNVLLPAWYFQGIEKMKYLALFNIAPKILFLALLFVFIKQESDYIYVPILFSLGFIISGLFSFLYSLKMGVSLTKVTQLDIKHQLTNGWHVFVGMLSSGLASNSVLFFIGVIANNTTLGIYAAIDKLIRPIANISNSFLHVIYPHMVNLKKHDHSQALKFSIKVTTYYMLALAIFSPMFIYFADILIDTFLDVQFSSSKDVLYLLIFLPFITSFLNIFLISNCLIYEQSKLYAKMFFISFLLSLVIIPILVYFFGAIGAAIAALSIESIKVILIGSNLYKHYSKVQSA